ncbi:hypothetical protein Moror_14684 [Moniliophthora roreri MCA 2997]|uniref:Uncharacterized protein n=1 Tax=Moniliophthora roreri (strain MCA 2997) TaxID=1381753 RepID=V2WNL1_MONRO|nr:hypothetical protein Moror_14684 [Moniliophthora roreri MCA 2997]
MTHVINVNNLPDSVKAQHMIISATRTAPLLCTTSHFCSRVILVKISLKGSMWGMRLRTFPKELMYTLLWKESSKAITNNHHLWTGKRMIGSAMNVCFCSSENIYTFGCWRKKRKVCFTGAYHHAVSN